MLKCILWFLLLPFSMLICSAEEVGISDPKVSKWVLVMLGGVLIISGVIGLYMLWIWSAQATGTA